MTRETIVREIFAEAIAALRPERLLARLEVPRLARRTLTSYRRMVVAGIGKSAIPWSTALHALVQQETGAPPAQTLAAVPDGYCSVLPDGLRPPASIEVLPGGHPLPDDGSIRAARRIKDVTKALTEEDLLILAISGGATAACNDFAEGVSLEDAVRTYELLLRAGLDIHAMNVIRKHISSFNGGRLAAAAQPAEVLALVCSDVPGDDLSVIAGGPVVPDPSTFAEAWEIVTAVGLDATLPHSVLAHLRAGLEARASETPPADDPVFERVNSVLIASNADARRGAASAAAARGFNPVMRDQLVTGEAREAGRALVREVAGLERGQVCFVAGGETTVRVRGDGIGGRNQELAVAAGMEIERLHRDDLVLLSAGTDGVDGPTDAAGALISLAHMSHARALALSPEEALRQNDTHAFCRQIDALVTTGPTHVNVMDLQLGLIRID